MKNSVQFLISFRLARDTLLATWSLSDTCAGESGLIVFRGIAEDVKAKNPGLGPIRRK